MQKQDGPLLKRKNGFMRVNFEHPIDWHVCFSDGTDKWWQKFLKRGFRHCWAFGYDPTGKCWLIVEPTWTHLVIRAFNENEFTPWIMKAQEEGPIIHQIKKNGPMRKSRLMLTCVSQIAYLVGLDLFPLTPWRLFCALCKAGGKRTFIPI